jgi:hypothetical protein
MVLICLEELRKRRENVALFRIFVGPEGILQAVLIARKTARLQEHLNLHVVWMK